MTVALFDAARITAAPWKNGGGLTREIVRRPEGADLTAFDWRVSIAAVAADGAFSLFAGLDRVIVLLNGRGVELQSADGRLRHRLDEPLVPFAFPGEDAIVASLIGGASSDFNVMTRRDRVWADVRVVRGRETIGRAEGGVLFAARGRWRVRAESETGNAGSGVADVNQTLEATTGLWWDGEALTWAVDARDAGGALIAVRVQPVR